MPWSNEKKAEYIQNLGLNIALQFEIFIEDINNQINNYLQSYVRIRFCEVTDYLIRFKNLLDEFADAINQLSPIWMPSKFFISLL